MKGILFKPDNIKAIVEGRKTQTRRLDGLKEINREPDEWMCVGTDGIWWGFERYAPDPEEYHINIKPRYRVGEVVYIKEAWAVNSRCDGLKPSEIPKVALIYYKDSELPITLGKWRSPMFMLQWAARYFIKITDVQPQRLQEINREDVLAEGVSWQDYKMDYKWSYQNLWDSIKGKKSPWESNPWVWRYIFQLLEKETLKV